MSLRLAALLLIASLLGGCGDGSDDAADPAESSDQTSPNQTTESNWPGVSHVGPVATHDGEPGVGDQAVLSGTLELDDGCLYVVDSDHKEWIPLLPNSAVRWEHGTLIYQGKAFADGQRVHLGGGTGSRAAPGEGFPAACEPVNTWVATGISPQ